MTHATTHREPSVRTAITPPSRRDAPRAALPDALRLGPVRLAITDLDRSVAFYTRVLGVEVTADGTENGRAVAHLRAPDDMGASTADVFVLQEEPEARRAGRHAGLYHVAYAATTTTRGFITADPWGIPLRVAVDPRTA